MKYFTETEIAALLPYDDLIKALQEGFRKGGNVPLRHHHTVEVENGTENNFMLMPCWQKAGMIGVKMVMVCPGNAVKDLASVQSTYFLSDATTGEMKAIFNGDELTVRRTACASALASSYLSSPTAETLLMMGTGKLAPHLIRAHIAVRNLTKIYIWGRRFEQAEKLAIKLNDELPVDVTAINDLKKYTKIADIISCATLSKDPILKGKWLNYDKQQHFDLVGGYTLKMREADNDVITQSSIYVDTFDGALAEAGDIIQPIAEGGISKDDICGDLFTLVGDDFRENSKNPKTLFKSVGTGLEDLIGAELVFQKWR